jgi:hypothetical protein
MRHQRLSRIFLTLEFPLLRRLSPSQTFLTTPSRRRVSSWSQPILELRVPPSSRPLAWLPHQPPSLPKLSRLPERPVRSWSSTRPMRTMTTSLRHRLLLPNPFLPLLDSQLRHRHPLSSNSPKTSPAPSRLPETLSTMPSSHPVSTRAVRARMGTSTTG